MKKSTANSEHYKWGENCDGWQLLKSDTLSVISEKMPSGASEILHYHAKSQQVFYVLSGEATFEIEGEIVVVPANESLHIPKKVWHKIKNESEEDLTFLVISEPDTKGDRIELLEFSDEHQTHVKNLNYEWLEKYFKVEAGDERSLADPRGQIIEKGGFVWVVRIDGQIVATVSLLKKLNGDFELGKMAVSEDFQGFGIGQMLIKHSFTKAKELGISKLFLYSNIILSPAIHLYRKFGFVETELESGLYDRANIKMVKNF
ncbi:GNAT family N-acetyltransferase [Flavobacterium sp.]|uniref:GNAT family N-acetyltransferase n=1 Tax=Flavobacterium sp. TaxID=239 RepID=UPI0011FE7A49|nr:GNAT family N-acetyltransferase [Flavobacterium sp.]RZJ71988.1 MAG: GNAT family N-acetyltransferase [Flavobacterium sp.]